jgi:DNA processing protein
MTCDAPMVASDPERFALLRLTLTSGLGPVLIRRLLEQSGSPSRAVLFTPAALRRIEGIGEARSASISASLRESEALAHRELDDAAREGVRFCMLGDEDYPPLLGELPDAPPVLYILGSPDWQGTDRYPFAIVGSRDCTHYGQEQARRFAGSLAQAGITIVSGGARGIDAAAHHAALIAGGRTIAVIGCGLGGRYPVDHADLFERVMHNGAIISELPMRTPPTAENFPARNRIISGLSLGVLVIEAGRRSGALITAKVAAEDHGRDVLALPGRVDSPASRGTLELIRAGGAALAIDPADCIAAIESAARHLHAGTHAARFPASEAQPVLFEVPEPSAAQAPVPANPIHTRILDALDSPAGVDELAQLTGLEMPRLRTELTILEIQGRIRRSGSKFLKNK